MRPDFSTAGRAARDTISVPKLPYDAIRRRSAKADFRARSQLLAVCFAVALVGLSTASGVAQKTLAGVRIWLSGGQAAVAVTSFETIREPLPADIQRVIDSASFAPVLPTRFPPGTHVWMLMYSPPSRPNTISLQYRNDRTGNQRGLTVVATAAIEEGSAPTTAVSGTTYSWRVGDETVLIPREHMNDGQIDALKTDLSSARPRTIPKVLLRTVTILGAPSPVAEAVQAYAGPASVLIGSQFVAKIPALARANQPLPDSRIVTLTNIPSKDGAPDYKNATLHWSSRTAVPSDGIKAVDAVLRASMRHCACAVLYSDETGGPYKVALVASSPPYAAVRYSVSKKTFSVRRADP
jgi:hypothetical protein